MSAERRDESRSHHAPNSNDRNLPPIREVFADELADLRVPPRSNAYSFREVRGALPHPEGTRSPGPWPNPKESSRTTGLNLAPIQQQPSQTYSRDGTPAPRSSSRPSRHPTHSKEDVGYSYGVLRTSGASGALVDATPPSERPQGILRQTAAPVRDDNDDPNKRYMCEYCGKRFGMPSHLEIHLRTHTAQRPFVCEWPNCDRAFSVRSNMMRHYRSHSGGGGGQQGLDRTGYEEYDDLPDHSSRSSHYTHQSSQSHSSSSGFQYSSSRRK